MDPEYAAIYPELYRRHWWWRAREAMLLEKIEALVGAGGPDGHILDVGCGAGLFFDALAKYGRVEGIESDQAAVKGSGRWHENIHVGELDETFRPHRLFDLILMLDVLEHVPRPGDMLRNAGRVLAPAGSVLVTVPAFEWLWTYHDELNRHLRRYTAQQMRQLIGESGLEVVETRYMFQSLVVPKLAVRVFEALVPASRRLPRVPTAAMNRLLRAWYQRENAIAGGWPFGSSLMAVARLPESRTGHMSARR